MERLDRYQKRPECCNLLATSMHQPWYCIETGNEGDMLVGMCYTMFVALPVHVNDRGVHFVDGVSHVLQLTAQATHDDANGLRSAIIK